MLRISIILLSICFTISCNSQTSSNDYIKAIKKERKKKNKEFSNKEKSPLEKEDVPNFIGLNYFPITPAYNVKAEFIKVDTATPFQMQTSTDRLPTYVQDGILKFEINGISEQLNVYKNLSNKEAHWFIPFIDRTNGLTTYGGGRYLDFELPKENEEVFLDFNKAYNPYCAYNHKYSCPIPPLVNELETAIEAGEKIFKEH